MIGSLRKLKNTHSDTVQYQMPLISQDKEEFIELNPLVGKKIKISFTGNIYCMDTGKKIKRSFGQGYSWESFNTKPQCDECIVRPELCHYASGTCRDEKWGEEHCLKPHIIYLANSSGVKVGITRKTQVPTRWMDQGASFALPILEVKDRLTSGLIEVEIAKKMQDKTNWRKMLKNDFEDVDLVERKKEVLKEFSEIIKKYDAKPVDSDVYTFNYPVEVYPEKVSSMNLDKKPQIEGTLMGIKGQYLIFDCGVINIRRHQGYEIEITY